MEKQQRPGKSERHRPGHRFEEPAFDSLQREDWQVRRDDDADCEEHRPDDFMRRIADLSKRRSGVAFALVAQMPHDVLHHHHGSIHHHAEIERSKRQQVRWNMAQVETDGCEQQSERNRERDNNRAAHVTEKHEIESR